MEIMLNFPVWKFIHNLFNQTSSNHHSSIQKPNLNRITWPLSTTTANWINPEQQKEGGKKNTKQLKSRKIVFGIEFKYDGG
jgi:hypothetical protein